MIVRVANTIILDPSTLSDWSNIAPLFGNIQTRKAILYGHFFTAASRLEVKKKEKSFAMPQENSSKNIKHNLETRGDIIGSMMLKDILKFP